METEKLTVFVVPDTNVVVTVVVPEKPWLTDEDKGFTDMEKSKDGSTQLGSVLHVESPTAHVSVEAQLSATDQEVQAIEPLQADEIPEQYCL